MIFTLHPGTNSWCALAIWVFLEAHVTGWYSRKWQMVRACAVTGNFSSSAL